jgi:MtaA/CmuA family methyltransferase
MTGLERITAALEGRRPDKVPVMLHNFMHAARESGVTMAEFRRSAETIAGAFIRAQEKYRCDGVLLDIDTATLAGALGVPVEFPEDEPARTIRGCLRRLEDIDDLKPVRLSLDPRIEVWLEAARRLKDYFRDDICVRGNCDQSAFSLAAQMRGLENWLLDLTGESNHPLIHRLLSYCADATKEFITLMAQTGVHMTSNGDSLAGPELISPAMYRAFALPYEKDIIRHAKGLGLPYVLHICGRADLILEEMVSTGAQGLELDQETDARLAHDRLKDRTAFFGNLDPANVLAMGSAALVEEKARALLAVFSDSPRFVLNAGCAIPPIAPEENIRAMIRVARHWPVD